MKQLALCAAAIGVSICMPVKAQEIGRYDKTIEKAAASQVADKIGSLRGLILADDANNFVEIDDLLPEKTTEGPAVPFAHRKAWQHDPNNVALPPMVMVDDVDPVITGRAQKYDSDGNPMRNHQEYPRPSPLSIARSILDAIVVNPYPGDS